MIGDFLKAQDNREIKFRAWVCRDYYDWEMIPAEKLVFGTYAQFAHYPVNVRHYAESSKVVGNVFENPELLEEGAKKCKNRT